MDIEKSTAVEKERATWKKLLPILIYLVIWSMLKLLFWMMDPTDVMAWLLLTEYLLLPVVTIVLAYYIGRDESWGRHRWLMILFFGAMYLLATYGTCSLSNRFCNTNLNVTIAEGLAGFLWAAFGMAVSYGKRAFGSKEPTGLHR